MPPKKQNIQVEIVEVPKKKKARKIDNRRLRRPRKKQKHKKKKPKPLPVVKESKPKPVVNKKVFYGKLALGNIAYKYPGNETLLAKQLIKQNNKEYKKPVYVIIKQGHYWDSEDGRFYPNYIELDGWEKQQPGEVILSFSSPSVRKTFLRNFIGNYYQYTKKQIKKGFLKGGENQQVRNYKNTAVGQRQIKKYNATEYTYEVATDTADADPSYLYDLVSDLINDVVKKYKLKDTDLIRFSFIGKTEGIIASTKNTQVKDFTIDGVLKKLIDSFVESLGMEQEKITSELSGISVTIIKDPVYGNGATLDKVNKGKRSIIQIKNNDNLCLGRCLVVARAMKDNHPQLKQIKMGRKIQDKLTKELYADAGIIEDSASLEVVKQFEEYLDCNINIIDSNGFNNIIYPDTNDPEFVRKEFQVYVYKRENHYDLINSNMVAGFFGKNYFCKNCNTTYGGKDKHKCKFKCPICCSTDCDCIGKDLRNKDLDWDKCNDCNRLFPSKTCFGNHKKGEDKSICSKKWKCYHPECNKIYDRTRFPMATHTHGEYWCSNCKSKVPKDHKCYMFPKQYNKPSEKYIFFDFEATQNNINKQHYVNYSVSQYYDSPEPIIHHNINDFCEWLFQKKHNDYTIIAHNGKGYDFQFIMKYIYRETDYKPFVIYAGSKIMNMSIDDKKSKFKIRFIDSVNFLTMPLAGMPGTFAIEELKKGYYPHYFNTSDNFNYVGPMPPIKDFGCDSFKDDKRNKFKKWYKEKVESGYVWDNYKELRDYCISDVDILRRCMIKFREIYLDIANIDPLQYTTIASVCMAIYRANYIVKDYNDRYCVASENKTLEEFNNTIREEVFKDKKIALMPIEDQEFVRKSFFGGRTNSTGIKYTFKRGEVGRYRDITSLYPSVNFYDTYGTGHLITKKSDFPDNYLDLHGFIDCYVRPPKDLYMPVLAQKGEKLTFDLEDKRGTWTTMELKKAVDKGYIVDTIYELKYYENTSKSLFKDYVSKFLKLKQESSGYPAWVKNNTDKDMYIQDYFDNQGIRLDKDKIEKNKGIRAIAKLCLNSLWGKFGMRLNMPQTEIISDKKRFNEVMFNHKKYTNQYADFIDDERVELKFQLQEDAVKLCPLTNIGIASFTTSHARLRLYEGLELLDRQVLYNDTDSIVYVYDKNNPNHKDLPVGDYLGLWTDELDGFDMVGTFVGAGPKNYSYETNDGEFHTKIKGFCLNYTASKSLNHFSMLELVDNRDTNEDNNYKEVETFNIKRTKDKSLQSIYQTKRYSFNYTKRHICPPDEFGNILTLPFGHEDIV